MTPRSYWAMVRVRAWRETWAGLGLGTRERMLSAILALVSVAGVLGFAGSEGSLADEMLGTAAWVLAFGACFLFCYLLRRRSIPHAVWQEQENEKSALQQQIDDLREAAKPKLKIESMDAPLFSKMILGKPLRTYRCSVTIRNTSVSEAVRGVIVRIIKFGDDNTITAKYFDAPQTVVPKGATINPDSFLVYKIAEGSHAALGESVRLQIYIRQEGYPFTFTGRHVPLTIEVSGENTPPTARDFILMRDADERPMLVPVDELSQAETGQKPDGSRQIPQS